MNPPLPHDETVIALRRIVRLLRIVATLIALIFLLLAFTLLTVSP
jgi:hypothetical protein